MALIHLDGFESYTDQTTPIFAANSGLLSITGIGSNMTFFGAFGRYSYSGLKIVNSAYHVLFTLSDPVSGGVIVGIAVKRLSEAAPVYNASEGIIIGLKEDSTYHLKLHSVGSEIEVHNGNGTLLGTTSGANILYDSWVYLEVKAVIDDSVGSVEVHANEVEVLALSSVDTKNGGTGAINVISLNCPRNDQHMVFDDLYICDTSGAAPCNDFLGDVRVDQLLPNAAGTYTQFTPSAGSNYENVDETGYSDGDTTYNETDSVGNKDSYNLASLPSPPSGTAIFGVRNVAVMRKTDVGARTAKQLLITGATETAGAEVSLSDSYQIFHQIFELNPADSAPFQDADINAIESGVEVAS